MFEASIRPHSPSLVPRPLVSISLAVSIALSYYSASSLPIIVISTIVFISIFMQYMSDSKLEGPFQGGLVLLILVSLAVGLRSNIWMALFESLVFYCGYWKGQHPQIMDNKVYIITIAIFSLLNYQLTNNGSLKMLIGPLIFAACALFHTELLRKIKITCLSSQYRRPTWTLLSILSFLACCHPSISNNLDVPLLSVMAFLTTAQHLSRESLKRSGWRLVIVQLCLNIPALSWNSERMGDRLKALSMVNLCVILSLLWERKSLQKNSAILDIFHKMFQPTRRTTPLRRDNLYAKILDHQIIILALANALYSTFSPCSLVAHFVHCLILFRLSSTSQKKQRVVQIVVIAVLILSMFVPTGEDRLASQARGCSQIEEFFQITALLCVCKMIIVVFSDANVCLWVLGSQGAKIRNNICKSCTGLIFIVGVMGLVYIQCIDIYCWKRVFLHATVSLILMADDI